MGKRTKEAPASDEIEVSVFGPGIGECCLIHLGQGKWFIVDSCEDDDNQPVAATYLQDLGYDLSNSVVGVLATHWHNDHIKGLANLFGAATSAKFYCPAAFNSEDLFTLLELQRGKADETTPPSELGQLFAILKERTSRGHRKIGVGPELVHANQLLHQSQLSSQKIEIKALSPSSEDIHRAHQDFAEYLPKLRSPKRRPVAFRPNDASAVLRLTIGQRSVIFGADRECTTNENTGWSVVIDSEVGEAPLGVAYKVAHHGSKNADDDRIWSEMLASSPISATTPYTPSGLPTDEDIARLKSRTPHAYLTAPPKGPKARRENRTVDKMMRTATRDRRYLTSEMGQIRLRFSLSAPKQQPEVLTLGRAFRL